MRLAICCIFAMSISSKKILQVACGPNQNWKQNIRRGHTLPFIVYGFNHKQALSTLTASKTVTLLSNSHCLIEFWAGSPFQHLHSGHLRRLLGLLISPYLLVRFDKLQQCKWRGVRFRRMVNGDALHYWQVDRSFWTWTQSSKSTIGRYQPCKMD